ncbi:uncharacterized protein [Spinacia oleracea]|uniref:Uncharacterized protein n=1 Tax=Spinacia oleracea TaxID=3562 RepID=A0ABM3R9A3_SPIOL|nr:uncharacterized protein LOC130467644 [Spinacia oleracea]
MQDVVKDEVVKLLDAGILYAIADFKWVSPVQASEFFYKERSFSHPFIDQMLEILAYHKYFCYLDGYFGFSKIPKHLDDQEKTTFTCPYALWHIWKNRNTPVFELKMVNAFSLKGGSFTANQN